MYAYVHRFRAHPLLKEHVMPAAAYSKFLKKVVDNKVKPPLDLDMLDVYQLLEIERTFYDQIIVVNE